MGRRTATESAEKLGVVSFRYSCHFPSQRSNLRGSGLLNNSEIPEVWPLLSALRRNLCRKVPFPSC